MKFERFVNVFNRYFCINTKGRFYFFKFRKGIFFLWKFFHVKFECKNIMSTDSVAKFQKEVQVNFIGYFHSAGF